MPRRVALYVRVSSTGQADNASLPTQEAACRAYCNERGDTIIGLYSDVASGGGYRDRPGLSELRALVRSGAVDVVLAYAIDRLSRNQAHLAILMDECGHHRTAVEFVTETFEDSAVGRFIVSARAFAAELEREKISERTVRGRKARVLSGKLAPTPRPLYGYQWNDRRERLIPNPLTAPVVQRIYRRCLEGSSLNGLATELTRDGIPTAMGRARWRKNSVHGILRHPAYSGQGTAWRGEIMLPAGIIPPLVSRAEWDAVQERLRRNQERARRNTRDPESALLRGGFARCGLCGGVMWATMSQGRLTYVCRSDGCPHPSTHVHLLDPHVWGWVTALLTEPERIRTAAALESTDPTAAELERLDGSLAEIDRQVSNLAQAIGMLSDPSAARALVGQIEALNGRRRAMEAERVAVLARQTGWLSGRARTAGLVDWCAGIAAEVPGLGWQDRRDVLDVLGVVVRVYPLKHRPRYVITCALGFDVAS